VPNRRALRVETRETALGDDARKVGQAHADSGERIPVETAGDFDRRESPGAFQLVLQVLHRDRRQVEQFAQGLDRVRRVLNAFRNEVDTEVRTVRGQRRAVAIENPAAARRYQREVDAVTLGLKLVFRVLGDRQIA